MILRAILHFVLLCTSIQHGSLCFFMCSSASFVLRLMNSTHSSSLSVASISSSASSWKDTSLSWSLFDSSCDSSSVSLSNRFSLSFSFVSPGTSSFLLLGAFLFVLYILFQNFADCEGGVLFPCIRVSICVLCLLLDGTEHHELTFRPGQQVRGHTSQCTRQINIFVAELGAKNYLWFIALPGITICALSVYDSEWEEIVVTVFWCTLCRSNLELASMHAADSGCNLGLIGALGASISFWWTPSGTMFLSVSAGLMSVGELIVFLRQNTLR